MSRSRQIFGNTISPAIQTKAERSKAKIRQEIRR